MSVPTSREGPGGVPGKPPHHLVSKRGRLSFRPDPPPPTSPCLSPPLGASRVGCGPCPTCGHAAQRSAESAQVEQPPEPAWEERPKERGERSSGPRQSIGASKNEKRAQNCKTGVRWRSRWRRRSSTQMAADSSIRRSCPSAGEWRRGARLSVEKRVEGRWW